MLSLGAIYSTSKCHFDLFAVDEVCAEVSINTTSVSLPFLSLQGYRLAATVGVTMDE